MRKLTTVFVTVIVTLAVIWLGLIGLAWSGAIDVAATQSYVPGVQWFLGTLTDHSIEKHARDDVDRGVIRQPATVTDAMLQQGASEYSEMCVTCHGGPGVDPGEIGKGLRPRPPDLSKATDMDPAEIYWVLSNGIRHTGMPAFGPTHSDQALWATAFFVNRLPLMTRGEFQRLAPRAESEHDEHEHGTSSGEGAP
jgi:mono/diheme cytochrome c family protein